MSGSIAPACPAAVRAAMDDIVLEEGPSHVGGRYVPDAGLAERARRAEAERRVDALARADRVVGRARIQFTALAPCDACGEAIQPHERYALEAPAPTHEECWAAARPEVAPLDDSDSALWSAADAEWLAVSGEAYADTPAAPAVALRRVA